jgi:hypothetical protein
MSNENAPAEADTPLRDIISNSRSRGSLNRTRKNDIPSMSQSAQTLLYFTNTLGLPKQVDRESSFK